MLSEKEIDKLVQTIVRDQESMSNALLVMLAQRLSDIKQFSKADLRKSENTAISATLTHEAIEYTNVIIKRQIQRIRRIVYDVISDVYADAKDLYDYRQEKYVPFIKNKKLIKIIDDTGDDIAAAYLLLFRRSGVVITDSKIGKRVFVRLPKVYKQVINEAISSRLTFFDDAGFESTMRSLLNQLIESGVRFEEDSKDVDIIRTKRISSATRTLMLDGIQTAIQRVYNEIGKDVRADGQELSVHVAPAPDHAPIQGHQFTNTEYKKLNSDEPFEDVNGRKFDAIPRAIGMWNCRHYPIPIIVGYSKPLYNQRQLNNIVTTNMQGFVDSKNRHYTLYEASQYQRSLETKIRTLKSGVLIAKAWKDAQLESAYLEKVKRYTREYDEFCKLSGLERHNDKLSVVGYVD